MSVDSGNSPKLCKSPSNNPKDWEKSSKMTGTSVDNLKRAILLYSNDVGPGHYE